MSTFAYARQAELDDSEVQKLVARRTPLAGSHQNISPLFLRIFAAADYFSLNKTLMSDVPPVLADVILDPYILNVFPKSLGPTAVYITVLAVGGWFLSGEIWKLLLQIAETKGRHGVEPQSSDKKQM